MSTNVSTNLFQPRLYTWRAILPPPLRGEDRARLVSRLVAAVRQQATLADQTAAVLRTTGRVEESGEYLLLEVTDSGGGIAVEKREFIFEEFSRLVTGDTAGAGLGLAISKLLAQRLGGRISVASEVGRGSTFALWLPLRRDERSDSLTQPARERNVTDLSTGPSPTSLP